MKWTYLDVDADGLVSQRCQEGNPPGHSSLISDVITMRSKSS